MALIRFHRYLAARQAGLEDAAHVLGEAIAACWLFVGIAVVVAAMAA